MKRNIPMFGFVIGALLPVIGYLLVYLILFRTTYSFKDFGPYLVHSHDKAAMVISLAVIINVIPFIFYTNKRLDLTARGILVATMLYAVFFILLKFVWN